MEQIVTILNLLNKYVPDGSLMTIRTTDISKRPENTPEEYEYAKFCEEAKSSVGIGTQDAMRKNLFVDLHRMRLIERYDKNKNAIDPALRNRRVKYVSITKQGLKLIRAENILDKYFIFSKGIDQLLGGCINIMLDILLDPDNDISNIEIHEFMFFISAIDTDFSFSVNLEKAIELIEEYRDMSAMQRKAVVEQLKSTLKPENFNGTKEDKRDYHNWHNEAAQIFYILDQTVYFEVRQNKLVLSTGKNGFASDQNQRRLNRSVSEKYKYFKKHGVDKKIGFELHHVVPLSWSENRHHFKMLDKWKNLVYIDGGSHAEITQRGNRNVVLDLDNNNVILSDFEENEVYLKNKMNLIYNPVKGSIMKQYNTELINTLD
ncbi:MAG: hypothetical protein ACR2P9_07445 [Gammaproteobacteria bacterium]